MEERIAQFNAELNAPKTYTNVDSEPSDLALKRKWSEYSAAFCVRGSQFTLIVGADAYGRSFFSSQWPASLSSRSDAQPSRSGETTEDCSSKPSATTDAGSGK